MRLESVAVITSITCVCLILILNIKTVCLFVIIGEKTWLNSWLVNIEEKQKES